MATLIISIQTIGEGWNELDGVTKHSLLQWIGRSARDVHQHSLLTQDVQARLRFSPLTGRLVTIGMYDLEREAGIVYYVDSEDTKETSYEAFSIRARNEKEMLEDFWEGAQSYDTFVTFGGREFDVPFLNIRSAVHGIRPSCPLMEDRYLTHQKNMYHVDLRDEFSYYGAVRRKASLHLFCRAFGIVSPIREEGVGESVDELFHAKRFQKIAERNARTVIATTKLYKKWLMYLAPYDFINRMG